MLVVPDSLAVLDKPHDHLPAKISGWVEGVIMGILVPNPQTLLDGCKKAISITIHLQITPLINMTDKAITALYQKRMLVKRYRDNSRYMRWARQPPQQKEKANKVITLMVIAFPMECAQYLQLLADNHYDCRGMPAPWNIPHLTQTHT